MAGWFMMAEGKDESMYQCPHTQSVSVKDIFRVFFCYSFYFLLNIIFSFFNYRKETWSNNNIRWKKILVHLNPLSSFFH